MMLRLPVSTIIDLVRKNLDEIAGHETQMIGADYDDQLGISVIVVNSIPEAIRQVHLEADPSLLEGKTAEREDYEVDGGLITMKVPVLRIVSFKAKESPYALNEVFSEASPVGRMQQDSYVRGTFDSPVIIKKSVGAGLNMPILAYYSFKDETDSVEHISYIPYPEDKSLYYEISPNLLDAFISTLTSLTKNIIGIQA